MFPLSNLSFIFHLSLILLVLSFIFINRFRGGFLSNLNIPVDSRITSGLLGSLVVLIFGLHSNIAMLANPFISALAFFICWLIWAYPPWAEWMHLGQTNPGTRTPTWFEALINKITNNNAAFALLIRMTIFLIPMAIVFGWEFLVLGPLLVVAYVIGKAVNRLISKLNPLVVSELIAGLFWGLTIAFRLL